MELNMIQWIIDNKEWLFSGIGVTLLLGAGYILKSIYHFKLGVLIDGYYIPSSLSYFRHQALDETDDSVTLDVRRIISVHATRKKKINIEYPLNTQGAIEAATSISDPNTMEVINPGQSTGKNSITINAKRGNQYIIASESVRKVWPFKESEKAQKDNIVIRKLQTERLTSNQHDFVGTRVIGKTNTQRIVVEFDKAYKPNSIEVIQIGKNGEILRDERSADFIKTEKNDGRVFVVELHNPEPESGIYVWWKWPNEQG